MHHSATHNPYLNGITTDLDCDDVKKTTAGLTLVPAGKIDIFVKDITRDVPIQLENGKLLKATDFKEFLAKKTPESENKTFIEKTNEVKARILELYPKWEEREDTTAREKLAKLEELAKLAIFIAEQAITDSNPETDHTIDQIIKLAYHWNQGHGGLIDRIASNCTILDKQGATYSAKAQTRSAIVFIGNGENGIRIQSSCEELKLINQQTPSPDAPVVKGSIHAEIRETKDGFLIDPKFTMGGDDADQLQTLLTSRAVELTIDEKSHHVKLKPTDTIVSDNSLIIKKIKKSALETKSDEKKPSARFTINSKFQPNTLELHTPPPTKDDSLDLFWKNFKDGNFVIENKSGKKISYSQDKIATAEEFYDKYPELRTLKDKWSPELLEPAHFLLGLCKLKGENNSTYQYSKSATTAVLRYGYGDVYFDATATKIQVKNETGKKLTIPGTVTMSHRLILNRKEAVFTVTNMRVRGENLVKVADNDAVKISSNWNGSTAKITTSSKPSLITISRQPTKSATAGIKTTPPTKSTTALVKTTPPAKPATASWLAGFSCSSLFAFFFPCLRRAQTAPSLSPTNKQTNAKTHASFPQKKPVFFPTPKGGNIIYVPISKEEKSPSAHHSSSPKQR